MDDCIFETVNQVEKMISNKFAILLDTKGPWIRTGELAKEVTYEHGERFKIVTDKNLVDDPKTMYIDYENLVSDVNVDNIIRIDSGVVDIRVLEKHENYLLGVAENKATIWSKRHVNLPWIPVKLPAITEKDKSDIVFGIEKNVSYVALSFTRKASDIEEMREFLYKNNGAHIKIVAKIENQEGIDNISDIIRVADAIMVARGDLGAEVPIETIPSHQMNIVAKTKRKGKKVIVATQMMESMMTMRVPTRAEVTDVFNAVLQGADYLMLSGETSVGKYPISCVKTMNRVIAEGQKYM
jgi:pyruvate kinase